MKRSLIVGAFLGLLHLPSVALAAQMSATKTSSIAVSGRPFILSRSDWGADSELLYPGAVVTPEATGDTGKGDNGTPASGQPDQRVKDCEAAQKEYPHEFKVEKTVKTDVSGKKYLWPIQYSSSIKLIVVHHSALKVSGDPRSSVERVRALYKYHAASRGWGDIGYHFIIDEAGQIYEGRQGGARAVGGHAYCNNIGTLGIVLLGNFDTEEPTQAQAKSLQALTSYLAAEYHIDLGASVQYHGKVFPSPIVGHRDLLSTACPGFSLAGGMAQIRSNVLERRLDGNVAFPKRPSSSSSSSASRPSSVLSPEGSQFAKVSDGISFVGRTSISLNPGGKQRLSFQYTAPEDGSYEGKKIADVNLSHPDIKLWIDTGRDLLPISKGVLLPYDLPGGESLTFQLLLQAPMDNGTYSLKIGSLQFSLPVYGRRARTGEYILPFTGNPALIVEPRSKPKSSDLKSRVRPQSRAASSSASSRSATGTAASSSKSQQQKRDLIRILLSADPGFSVSFPQGGVVADTNVTPGTTLTFVFKDGECQTLSRGAPFLRAPILRLRSEKSTPLLVSRVKGFERQYRGVLECRVSDNALILINELGMEEYLQGLAEEPDTEPYEKQRAFAVAARSYAAYYLTSGVQKFPGKPYDGSDDPAVFQAYQGVGFEGNNPLWVKAVESTSGQVLTYKGSVLRVPYFSSDDGRTRSPAEAGWKSFPHPEVFSSKPDPWCAGESMRGHGVGMSGCGAKGQAKEGRSAEQILQYYYPGTRIQEF